MMRKPKIRFKGYNEDWEQRKLGELVGIYDGVHQTPDYQDSGIMFLSVENIATLKSEKYISEEAFERDYKVYPEKGDILMTRIGDVGTTNVVEIAEKVAFYVSLALLKPNGIDSYFLSNAMKTNPFLKGLRERTLVTAIPQKINKDEIGKIDIFITNNDEEQKKIGAYFHHLDHLITLHQHKCDEMKKLKKYMLQKLFPQNGKKVPEIRFDGFTNDWEQRKLGELVIIERGGSPRPIDKFITKDENGLNWIKIGDAPEQGNYITQTAEKIKPEGLSKTREVHPGDLILSNSMSFGKPYIMAIDGCIHDGWLVIRDTKKRFDLTFLCTLLGTDSMLNQYKAMAAGSAVNNLNKELVGGTTVLYPDIKEQELIGEYFSHLDHLITLHQHKCDELQNLKKYMLQNMFV